MPVEIEQRRLKNLFRRTHIPVEPNTVFTRILPQHPITTEQVMVMSSSAIGVRRANIGENIKHKPWTVIENEGIKKSKTRVLTTANLRGNKLTWRP